MSDDIKVDDEVKKAEAEMMAPKDESVPSHLQHISAHHSKLLEELAKEKKEVQERYQQGIKRQELKKAYFEECGLEWNPEIADMCDYDGLSTIWFGKIDDLSEYKKNVDTLADWFKKNATKLGSLL